MISTKLLKDYDRAKRNLEVALGKAINNTFKQAEQNFSFYDNIGDKLFTITCYKVSSHPREMWSIHTDSQFIGTYTINIHTGLTEVKLKGI